jgi:hypothetical protein
MDRNKLLTLAVFVALLFIYVGEVLPADIQPSAASAAEAKGAMSAEELNRQLNNPVSSVWSMVFQNNYTQLKSGSRDVPGWDEGDEKWFYNLNFQPVLPLPLTRDWNLINRPVFPIFADRPVLKTDGFDEVDGLGDIGLVSLLSPAKTAGGLLWGVGPTFIFPTATKDELGQEKWQAGPAAVGVYLGKEWIFGAFPQHWWSFAGNDDRKSTSQTNIQYFIWRLFPGQWQIGTAPNILIDWKADNDNKLTLPVGLGVGKLLKIGGLPIKFILEGQYAVIHPDDFGQEWNIRFTVTPVLPSLIKNPIFD